MGSQPARLEITSHRSEVGWWEMVSRPPAERLRRHVLGYCGYEEETFSFTRRRELPSGAVVVIIGFGPKLSMAYAGSPDPPAVLDSFVAGLHESHCMVTSPGDQAGIQMNMTPLGAFLLFGVPMHELSNRVVGLDDLLGRDGRLLRNELGEAEDWGRRFDILDRALVRRLESPRSGTPDVAWAWNELMASGGRMRVDDLCERIGCSRGHLARRFAEQIGLSPKATARVLRFDRAVRLIGHRDGASWGGEARSLDPESMSWSEIALHCGYFDQAHMNRDFRDFAAATPAGLAAALLPDSGGLPA